MSPARRRWQRLGPTERAGRSFDESESNDIAPGAAGARPGRLARAPLRGDGERGHGARTTRAARRGCWRQPRARGSVLAGLEPRRVADRGRGLATRHARGDSVTNSPGALDGAHVLEAAMAAMAATSKELSTGVLQRGGADCGGRRTARHFSRSTEISPSTPSTLSLHKPPLLKIRTDGEYLYEYV